jgi:hypothetical protein
MSRFFAKRTNCTFATNDELHFAGLHSTNLAYVAACPAQDHVLSGFVLALCSQLYLVLRAQGAEIMHSTVEGLYRVIFLVFSKAIKVLNLDHN